MYIVVNLPKEIKSEPPFTRAAYGELALAEHGILLFGPAPCLGKGGRIKSAKSGNWKLKGNDTPTGSYIGRVVFGWQPVEAYGPEGVITLEPVGGNALEAATLGRNGFAIHGGRDQQTLWSTEGCVRAFDRHMRDLISILQKRNVTEIEVSIVEYRPEGVQSNANRSV